MDFPTFHRLLEEVLDTMLESLVAIENEAQRQERPVLHELARLYAGMIAQIRNYLSTAQTGRTLPRQLAKNLSNTAGSLVDLEDDVMALHLHPDLSELSQLIRVAETVT